MAGVSGWERVTDVIYVPDGYTQSVSVYPSSGKVMVGGGFVVENPGVWVITNRASTYGDAWDLVVHNSSGSTQTVRVYGIAVDVA